MDSFLPSPVQNFALLLLREFNGYDVIVFLPSERHQFHMKGTGLSRSSRQPKNSYVLLRSL